MRPCGTSTKRMLLLERCSANFTFRIHRGEIEIIFHPTAEQIPAFQFVPAVSLYARSQPARFVLRSDEIWHEGAQTGMQDGISFMYSCKGRASNLEIRNLLGQSKSNTLKAGTFWLTAGWPTFAPLFFAKVGAEDSCSAGLPSHLRRFPLK